MDQLNNSHVDPIFYFIEEFEIIFFGDSLAFLYRTSQFCIEPTGWRKPGGFLWNWRVQRWNQPISYGTGQKRFESVIWLGEACKPVQPGGFFKTGWVLITLDATKSHLQCLAPRTEWVCALKHLLPSWQGPCTHKVGSWSHHLVEDVEDPGDGVEAFVDDG